MHRHRCGAAAFPVLVVAFGRSQCACNGWLIAIREEDNEEGQSTHAPMIGRLPDCFRARRDGASGLFGKRGPVPTYRLPARSFRGTVALPWKWNEQQKERKTEEHTLSSRHEENVGDYHYWNIIGGQDRGISASRSGSR
ncbi:unnamed protein product, partial [Phaeothamnion confervicola]